MNNKQLSCNEGKDETLLSISFIKPSTKIRNNVIGDRVQPCATLSTEINTTKINVPNYTPTRTTSQKL